MVAESDSGDGEDQVVYRAGVRRVPRLSETNPTGGVRCRGVDKHSSHLVIGATGNIGPHLIQQLADMGAATIVAVSRNPGSRLDTLTGTLAAQGTTLVTVAADASDEAAMTALFDRFGADLPPLDGIYLAAYGGGPMTLRDMTDDDVNAMFRPKLDVVSLLHNLSLKTPVRHFVLFSSISGLLGSRWLGHYAATTTFLDTFAYARRAAGLSATTVNWGLWNRWPTPRVTNTAGSPSSPVSNRCPMKSPSKPCGRSRVRMPRSGPLSSPPTGLGSPPHTASAEHSASSTTWCPPTRTNST